MHRSSSTTRASEEQYYSHAHATSPPSKPSPGLRVDNDELPLYDPLSDLAKKEKLRIKFAENAVHVIPLVLVICAITLWFFSNPEVSVMNKDGSIVARVEGLRIDTDIDVHGGLVSDQEAAMDPPSKHKKNHKGGKSSKEKSK